MDVEDISGIKNYRTRMAWPTGSTLASSSAETGLHFLENFLERMFSVISYIALSFPSTSGVLHPYLVSCRNRNV